MDTTVPAQSRVVNFVQVNAAVAPNTWGAAINLVADTDLQLHGGEDAVLVRTRGRLMCFGGRTGTTGATPAPLLMRVAITLQDVTSTLQLLGTDLTTGFGIGRDDILWSREVLVSGTTVLGNGTASTTETSPINDYWFDVDVKAKRKMQSDRLPHIWFQTVGTGATQPFGFTLAGFLRMLVMRPR